METYIAVDLEMTGLRVKRDKILEIGAVRIEGDGIADAFQIFVNPHRRLTAEVTELTGITDDMVADAPDEQEALGAFLRFAGELPLVGHNVWYDYIFLKQCAVNHGLQFERKGIDTLKIARKLLSEPEKKSLEALCAYFGIAQAENHRALADAKSAAELFLALREKYAAAEGELFVPAALNFRVKRQQPATPAQKRDLNHLLIYHRIEADVEIDSLTKSEASRMIDRIYAQYGRIPRQEVPGDV